MTTIESGLALLKQALKKGLAFATDIRGRALAAIA